MDWLVLLRCIFASIFEDDLRTARMFCLGLVVVLRQQTGWRTWQKVCYIISFTVNNDPAGFVGIVLRDLLACQDRLPLVFVIHDGNSIIFCSVSKADAPGQVPRPLPDRDCIEAGHSSRRR